MTADPLERLREADPVPGGGSPPSFASVMDRVRAIDPEPGGDGQRAEPRTRARRPPWTRALRPALGVAAALAVVAIVVFAVAHHGRTSGPVPGVTPTQPATAPVPAPSSLMPRHGGMIGLVSDAAIYGSGSDLTATVDQCASCTTHFQYDKTHHWAARSTDGGRSWHVARVPGAGDFFGREAQSGSAVWAPGSHGNASVIFVSHDGGRTFATATTPVPASTGSTVTISDGTVWVFTNRCVHNLCHAVVLSGPVGGDRLTPTATQPALPRHRFGIDASISASGPNVYLTGVDDGAELETFASHDRGRTWARVTYPCRRPVEGDVDASGPQSLWAMCLGSGPAPPPNKNGSPRPGRDVETIRRSSDGGRHWTTTPASLADTQPTLEPASDQVAWIVGLNGTIQRTSDGGRSWQTVLHIPQRGSLGAQLAVQSAAAATTVVATTTGTIAGHNRRTELIAYRTSDGGAHWTPSVIHLPAR